LAGSTWQAGRSFTTSQSFGSIQQSINVRPQKVANIDANSFLSAMSASHDVKYGFGFRTVDAIAGTLYPGNMILADRELTGPISRRAFIARARAAIVRTTSISTSATPSPGVA